ncbi:hypothetical protein QVD17_19150 [Tagetes erecta]|uniref:Uncharacterized protein n=1 Tax=Tagetes erecta TaxID=13708 RepID=A0AAD8NX19_TARER|nr:hypothetical protein QVD17_19150 [Tagetes erecta]
MLLQNSYYNKSIPAVLAIAQYIASAARQSCPVQRVASKVDPLKDAGAEINIAKTDFDFEHIRFIIEKVELYKDIGVNLNKPKVYRDHKVFKIV